MYTKILLLLGFFILLLKNDCRGNVFTSVMKMRKVPEIEQELTRFLEKYLENAENTEYVSYLQRFLKSSKEANDAVLAEENYVENPINSYKLLRRLTVDWYDVIENLTCDECDSRYTEFADRVAELKTRMGVWPQKDDFLGANLALIRLVNTYKLPLHLLAKGIIYDTQTTPLSAHEFSLIGDVARERDLAYESIMWYNQSMSLFKNTPDADQITFVRTMKKLSSAWFNYGMPARALEIMKQARDYDPDNVSVKRDADYYSKAVKRLSEKDKKRRFTRPPHPHFPYYFKYEALCRGQIKSPKEMVKLYCDYRPTAIPILWTKVEYANVDPPVVLFHDVINDKEIDWMTKTAAEQLSRSILGDVENSRNTFSEARISENAWLADNYNMTIKLGKRITLITGLDASVREFDTYAEPFQVLNYGLGGMYEPHHDFTKLYREHGLEDSLAFKNAGDRVATWMFYLNDVKAGGATVFPNLRSRVPAIKGAAAFWYNIKRSGELDDRSLHAGCPLLLGSKWAANKWFREVGQAFRYGCTLNPED